MINIALKAFAKKCGLEWELATHQFRRKFANYAARSQFGDLRYLKQHFKHWSLDMTLGYALNESQECCGAAANPSMETEKLTLTLDMGWAPIALYGALPRRMIRRKYASLMQRATRVAPLMDSKSSRQIRADVA
jgi:hypothetical protein